MRLRFGCRRTSLQSCCLPKKLEAGDLHGGKEVTSPLGRLQWVAKAFTAVSSHLQPLYAWEQKLQRRCKPRQLVRFLATLMLRILDREPAPLRKLRAGPCHGSNDAGESDTRASIGGWFSTPPNADKFSVYWFAILRHTTQKRRICLGDDEIPAALHPGG